MKEKLSLQNCKRLARTAWFHQANFKREKWRNFMVESNVDWLKFPLPSRLQPNSLENIAFIVRICVRLSRTHASTNQQSLCLMVSLTLRSFYSAVRSLLRCALWIYFIHVCLFSFAPVPSIWKHTRAWHMFSFFGEQEGQLRIVCRTQQTCICALRQK